MSFRTLRPERSASAIPPPRPALSTKNYPWLAHSGQLLFYQLCTTLPINSGTVTPQRHEGKHGSTKAPCHPTWRRRQGPWFPLADRMVGYARRYAELQAWSWPSVWQRQLKKWYNYGTGHSRDARRGIT